MMIKVIEQNSSERDQEVIDLFNQIKPLLDEGHSYWSAMKMMKDYSSNPKMLKKIKEYGATQGYFPDCYERVKSYLVLNNRRSYPNAHKYGLLNVTLLKSKRYSSGYQWRYRYFDGERYAYLSNCDLKKLREIVEERGLEWKVIDLTKAKKAYEFNKEIQEQRALNMHNINKSGVLRVFKRKCPLCKQGYSWCYQSYTTNKSTYFSSVDPGILKQKVLESGNEWIILDEQKAKENGLL